MERCSASVLNCQAIFMILTQCLFTNNIACAKFVSPVIRYLGCIAKKGVGTADGRLIRLQEFPHWFFSFHFSATVLYTR